MLPNGQQLDGAAGSSGVCVVVFTSEGIAKNFFDKRNRRSVYY